MSANSTRRAAELAALIARHSTLPPHQIAAHVLHLQRIARQLKAIAERQCNGYAIRVTAQLWKEDTAARDRDQSREVRLASRADDICTCLNGANPEEGALQKPIAALEGGDPRGPCLRLLIEGERGDGWDDDGGYALNHRWL